MQSMLLAPSKASKSVVNHDNKPVNEVTGKQETEKSADHFSSVLENEIKEKDDTLDGDLASSSEEASLDVEFALKLSEQEVATELSDEDTSLASVDELSEELGEADNSLIDKDLFSKSDASIMAISPEDGSSEETTETDVLSEKEVYSDPNAISATASLDNELSAESASSMDFVGAQKSDDEKVDSDLSDSTQINDQVISPILEQIEVAQKIDTKVSDSNIQLVATETSDAVKSMKKIDKGFLKEVGKLDKKSFENALADDPDNLAKELPGKNNLALNDKLDALLPTLKSEVNKPIFNQNVEGNVFNTLGMATTSADKLLNQTRSSTITNPVLQSSLLQQPIELQAKHASAMIGERILMMLGQGKQEVTIRLDPAELGSMHIKLQVQQDQLQVAIQTQVGQSRDIIEQNLPRLREQLAQQGINLSEASVEQQSKQDQSSSQNSDQAGNSSRRSAQEDGELLEEENKLFTTQIPLPAQGIDYYA